MKNDRRDARLYFNPIINMIVLNLFERSIKFIFERDTFGR